MRVIKFAKGSSGRPSGSYTLSDGRTRGVQLREPASNDFLVPVADLAAVGAGTGGTLAAGDWLYLVTATDAVGEATASNEAGETTTGSTSVVNLSWTAVPDATGYRVYRATTAGGPYQFLDTSATNSYADTGAATPTTGVPPVVNTSGKRATVHFDIRGTDPDSLIADVRGQGTRTAGQWHL